MEKISLKFNAMEIVERAVESGVEYGWNRAHKHVNDPGEFFIKDNLIREIMNSLSDVVEW